MRNAVWGDYKSDEFCLEKSFDVKMYHVSPRMWDANFPFHMRPAACDRIIEAIKSFEG